MSETLFELSTPDGPRTRGDASGGVSGGYIPERTLPHNRTETSMKAANGQGLNKVTMDRNAIVALAGRFFREYWS